MSHRWIVPVIVFLLVTVVGLATPRIAAAKHHHRSEMDRFNAKIHHREAKEEHWAAQSDLKAQEAEEKHAQHEGKWEQKMDEIGRPQSQVAPPPD